MVLGEDGHQRLRLAALGRVEVDESVPQAGHLIDPQDVPVRRIEGEHTALRGAEDGVILEQDGDELVYRPA